MKTKKIIITGGGTAGSTTPLLSIADKIQDKETNVEFLFVGTRKGEPEKKLAQAKNIPYKSICSGKLRRYFSFKNFIDPFKVLIGFFQSIFLIKKFKPDAILGAGSFVAVPVSLAGFVLKVPVFVHQLDIKPGLANKIISFFATKITLSFESLKKYFHKNSVVTGTPVRNEVLHGNKKVALKEFDLKKDLKTVLIMGGGTGAQKINKIVLRALDNITDKAQVIHITGKDKLLKARDYHYRSYEFLTDALKHAYTIADIVVSRAGVGSVSELSRLGKPTIFIPLPHSSQVQNARVFCKKQAAICIKQSKLNEKILSKKINDLLGSDPMRKKLSKNIMKLSHSKASSKIADIILKNI